MVEVVVTNQVRAVSHTVEVEVMSQAHGEVMVRNQGSAVMQWEEMVIVAREMGTGKWAHAEPYGRGRYRW
jgi:hypothetical protein